MGMPASPSQGYVGMPGIPAYSQGAPGYPPAFGQAAPPSQGYPGQGYPGVPAMSAYPGAPGTPAMYAPPPGALLPPVRERRTGLVVGILALVVALLAAIGGVAILTSSHHTAAPLSPSAAATASAASGPGVILNDPMTANNHGWPDDDTHCTFEADGYHIIDSYICYAPVGLLTDATIQVRAEQLQGPLDAGYGFALRRTSEGDEYYFVINAGDWTFQKCIDKQCVPIVDWTANSAIRGGLHASNTLKVQMRGSQFTFYVNGTQVGSASDTTYSEGKVGLAGANGATADVLFTQVLITKDSNG